MKNVSSSPLWLIGVFIIFAEATAGVAAVNVNGWPQHALVLFVIAYSTFVTIIFFLFLWRKPENFYGPADYGDVSPEDFTKAIRGMPKDTVDAVKNLSDNPENQESLFSLLDNLIDETEKQFLILMEKFTKKIPLSEGDIDDWSSRYELITKQGAISIGIFRAAKFLSELDGTDLVEFSDGEANIRLTDRGSQFAKWMIDSGKEAETFRSPWGHWGKDQSVEEVMKRRFGQVNEDD